MEIIGIVTRLTPFNEKDAMINIVTEERTTSFLARGVLGIASKNMASVQPFTKSSFVLAKGKDGLALRTGTALATYGKTKERLEGLTSLSFIGELTNKVIASEEASKIYPFLERTLALLEDGFHALTLALLYFAAVLRVTGYGLEVTKCVISGQKSDIAALSYLDGGFVAAAYFDALRHQKCSERELKIIRQIFLAQPEDFNRVTFERRECLKIINDLAIYLSDAAGTRLKSLALLEKVS
ncbi:MAG: DNA repair protein RecO [Bacilli bacterium]|jgi:DNA repair protein RecO